MIRSSKLTLKFTNSEKRSQINLFIDEYKNVVSQFIDILWEVEKVPSLLPKNITFQVDTWLSARAVQCAGKQASGIVRGTRKKQENRLFILKKLKADNKISQAHRLETVINQARISKPKISDLSVELDERFVKQDWNNSTSFDGIVSLTSLGYKRKLQIPVKKHKHFNNLSSKGKILKGVRLSKNFITFNFEIEGSMLKQSGKTIGIDIGVKKLYTASNGVYAPKDNHNHSMESILNSISKKKKGSKAFSRVQRLRKNYINWAVNQINLENVCQINIEKIKKFSKSSRKLSHFNYAGIFEKLVSYAYENGVHVHRVNPAFTSQRCSACGWTQTTNRNRELFKCKKCNFTSDADLNGAINISLDLPILDRKIQLSQTHKTGFYWSVIGQEFIVPDSPKTGVDNCLHN